MSPHPWSAQAAGWASTPPSVMCRSWPPHPVSERHARLHTPASCCAQAPPHPIRLPLPRIHTRLPLPRIHTRRTTVSTPDPSATASPPHPLAPSFAWPPHPDAHSPIRSPAASLHTHFRHREPVAASRTCLHTRSRAAFAWPPHPAIASNAIASSSPHPSRQSCAARGLHTPNRWPARGLNTQLDAPS
jgi:hypothetical protein